MKAMETTQMVAIPADALKGFPQAKMAPNPVSPVNMASVTNGATPIPATNGEATIEETEKSSIGNGDNGKSQPSVGIKRKDDGTKDSKAPDLKKIRLFKDSDDEDDPDDPAPQTNGNSSDNDHQAKNDQAEKDQAKNDQADNNNKDNNNIEKELQKRLEKIPETSREMEAAQTDAIHVLGEVNKVLQPKEIIKQETKLKNETSKEELKVETKEETKDETKLKSKLLKEEVKVKSKLRRLSRKELENMIINKLNEKILNDNELGKLKQLSEKLETTLETNRKKALQFHKEIDDLKKVTEKLKADHISRKGQYVAPIRIKRSVGIQATENIIKKGAMFTSNGTAGPYKTIAPRPGVSKGPIATGQPTTPTPGTYQPQGVRTVTSATQIQTLGTVKAATPSGPTQMMVTIPKSQITAALSSSNTVSTVNTSVSNSISSSSVVSVGPSRMIRAPIVSPQGSVIRPGQHQLVIQQQQPISKAITASTANTTTSSAKTNTSGAVIDIDLTDEDEGNRARTVGNLITTPGTVLKVPVSSTGPAILLLQPQTASGGVPRASVVSIPVTGQTTTLVSASRVNSTIANTISLSKATPVTGATAAAAAVVAAAAATTQGTSRHPAPLPRTPPQQQVGGMRNLPPQPTLKLSHKDNSIVLSWTMSKTEEHESIASYQLYAYQEGTTAPSSDLWKKVGSVKALELPMACTLTQFMPGHVYHFAVRAVDSKSRLGPFSEPRSIRLDR